MSLQDDKQQNIQMELDFSSALTGEAREAGREGTESSGAMNGTENPASTNRLMEAVCERENRKGALRQVRANQGSPGVDGMTVVGLKDYLKEHWPAIREQLLNGTYEPQPVRRVEIRKLDGGMRKLGIPTVLDRFIQQAVMQVLQRRWDRTFSEHSYGFRPGRSAHQAVAQAQQYIAEGRGWCVDVVWQGSAGDRRPYADQTGVAESDFLFARPGPNVPSALWAAFPSWWRISACIFRRSSGSILGNAIAPRHCSTDTTKLRVWSSS
ncbi:MAG: hypothetical protein ACLQU1_22675 [Bryobacteraceae bacterium]